MTEITTGQPFDREYLIKKAACLRRKVLELTMKYGDAHLGSCFSGIEIMTILYHQVLKEEDKFILSKGHASQALYAVLQERGYSPKISGHPDIDQENGICCTTGSLGHGLPLGAGMAIARKKSERKGNIYVLMGDGECEEGTTWETSLIASKYELDNLTAIVDHNKLQALEKLVLPLENLGKKFETFGWDVREVEGHNFQELDCAFKKESYKKPRMIIAHTIKGKGVSFMENDPKWHARLPTAEELKIAYGEIG